MAIVGLEEVVYLQLSTSPTLDNHFFKWVQFFKIIMPSFIRIEKETYCMVCNMLKLIIVSKKKIKLYEVGLPKLTIFNVWVIDVKHG